MQPHQLARNLTLGLQVRSRRGTVQTIRALSWIDEQIVVHYKATADVDRYALDESVEVAE